jgi:hypothetical protein
LVLRNQENSRQILKNLFFTDRLDKTESVVAFDAQNPSHFSSRVAMIDVTTFVSLEEHQGFVAYRAFSTIHTITINAILTGNAA